MQKITPFLWFDNQAEEAIYFYTSIFKNAKIGDIRRYGEAGPGPEGSVMTGSFELEGQQFIRIKKDYYLRERETVCITSSKQEQKIFPFFLFVGEQHAKAEEAINFYISQFKNSSIVRIERFSSTDQGGSEGTAKHAVFSLNGQEFMAMDSNREHPFTFTPAISFFVNCETQEEVDALWEKLSEGGEKDACGWLKDKYGLSWQIVPSILGDLLGDPDPVKSQRVMRTMLQMKKLDIKVLQQAYKGE